MWAAFKVTLASQVTRPDLSEWTRSKLVEMNGSLDLLEVDFSQLIVGSDGGTTRSGNLVLTASRRVQASAVVGCIQCGMPVLLEGPAAVGKTALIEFLSKNFFVAASETPLLRVNNSASTTVQDYLGSYLPSGHGDFHFREDALVKAMRCGYWFLADEFNLAEPAVMSILYPILEGQGRISIPGTDRVVFAHKNFRFFATQNQARGYAGRFDLPLSLRNRMLEVQVSDFDATELPTVIRGRAEAGGVHLSAEEAESIAEVYQSLKSDASNYKMTLRDVVKWIKRKDPSLFSDAPWGRIGLSLFESLLHQIPLNRQAGSVRHSAIEAEALFVEGTFSNSFRLGEVIPNNVSIKPEKDGVMCSFSSGLVSVSFRGINLEASRLWNFKDKLEPPVSFQKALVCVAFAVKAKEPILLIGPSCFKSLLVCTWAEITGRSDIQIVSMIPDTDSCDIVGQIQPYSLCDLVSVIISGMGVLRARVSSLHQSRNQANLVSSQEREDYGAISRLLEKSTSSSLSLEALLSVFLGELQAKDDKKQPHSPEGAHDAGPGIDDYVMFQDFEDNFEEDLPEDPHSESRSHSSSGVESRASEDDSMSSTSENGFNACESGSESRPSSLRSDSDEGEDQAFPSYGVDEPEGREGYSNAIPAVEEDSWEVVPSGGESSDEEENLWRKYDEERTSTADQTAFTDEVIEGKHYAFLCADAPSPEAPAAASAPSTSVFGQKKTWKKKKTAPAPATDEQAAMGEPAAREDFSDEETFRSYSEVPEEALPADDEQSTPAPCWQDYDDGESTINIAPELRQNMDNLEALLARNEAAWQGADTALFAEVERLKHVWKLILDIEVKNGRDSKPIFLFKDGVVTASVKRGQLLLIEDFDLPNQAVVERLNSLLEPSPSFSITEDITMSSDAGDHGDEQHAGLMQNIPILPSFTIFATVHSDSTTGKLNLSPATRSRFTEIHVKAYAKKDLKEIVKTLFRALQDPALQIEHAVDLMFVLRNEVNSCLGGDQDSDIHKLFRMVYFVLNHATHVDLVRRVWLAARFFYFDALNSGHYQEELMEQCLRALQKLGLSDACASTAILQDIKHIFSPPARVHGAIVFEEDGNTSTIVPLSSIIEWVGKDGELVYRLKYTGVCFTAHEELDLQALTLGCAPIQSFVNQVSRITAAISTGCPLLLEGPPGTGKTAVVSQVRERVCDDAFACCVAIFPVLCGMCLC